jgi:hypothetical protein
MLGPQPAPSGGRGRRERKIVRPAVGSDGVMVDCDRKQDQRPRCQQSKRHLIARRPRFFPPRRLEYLIYAGAGPVGGQGRPFPTLMNLPERGALGGSEGRAHAPGRHSTCSSKLPQRRARGGAVGSTALPYGCLRTLLRGAAAPLQFSRMSLLAAAKPRRLVPGDERWPASALCLLASLLQKDARMLQ